MQCDFIILPGSTADAPLSWMRVVDGHIVHRGRGENWRHPAETADGPVDGRALLVLPAHETTLHWIVCPEMTVRQGAVAAQVMALESSIGGSQGQLHAVTLAAGDVSEPHIVAIASEAVMQRWVSWCASHGLDDAVLVPAALLLPAPEAGPESAFVRARVGNATVLRGVDSACDADDPVASLILGDTPVRDLTVDEVDGLLLAALENPPLDLRQGAFARVQPRFADGARLKRMALIIGLILLAALLVSLVQIARLNYEASRLDAQTVQLAQTIDPSIADAAEADVKMTARLAARGGDGGFSGAMASIMSAMQVNAAVSLASVSQTSDGSLRVQFAATRTEDINAVLIALQGAGWRISASSVQPRNGKLVADILVVR